MSDEIKPTQTAIAVREDSSDVPALSFDGGQMAITSLDLKDEQQSLIYIRAMSAACEPLANHLNEPLVIKHAVAHTIEIVDNATAEVKSAVRLALITEHDAVYVCVSSGAWRSVRNLCSVWGAFPWSPPRTVVCRQIALKDGKRMFEIEPWVAPGKPGQKEDKRDRK